MKAKTKIRRLDPQMVQQVRELAEEIKERLRTGLTRVKPSEIRERFDQLLEDERSYERLGKDLLCLGFMANHAGNAQLCNDILELLGEFIWQVALRKVNHERKDKNGAGRA